MADLSTAQSATPEEHVSPPSERPKVVYVMGSGRSGSTILGVTLGNCADVFFGGELNSWLSRSGTPPIGGAERTRFWNAVREEIPWAEAMFGTDTNRCVERSSAVFRVDRWPARRRLRKRYRRVAEGLYHAVAHASGATHVVDTSHFPLRAREVQQLEGIDLYIVFLVRDPQGVAASKVRHINRHAAAERRARMLATNGELWLTHLLSLLVFLSQPRERRMFLRYEDFVADPDGMLRDILDRVDSAAPIPDLAALKTGFPLVGNKLISSETVALKSKKVERVRSSRMTALLQLPWAFIFSRLGPVVAATKSHERGAASRTS